ncbi:Imm30 family immunity protein [Paenibacillus sp. DMB5]|uniref:Imm30 family immunity protein n=1 Tax=Paenibacillus sp. DMB5 TaxID=1780103 RepID=UPI00076D7690|nr:Imm30 family immunity protein [Paenibacillus sp. DMB5]KUP22483.1 hypothetical protein AWJ19_00245 [Paenibacillus sp. DMB5]
MNLYPGIAQLYNNRLLRTELECELFDLALEGLAGDTDDAVIQQIFKVFDDETEHEEMMFSLVHYVESCHMEMYLTQLLESLPDMLEPARGWAIVLNERILNDSLFRKEYTAIAKGMSPRVKQALVFLLEEIRENKPRQYERKVNTLLGKIK